MGPFDDTQKIALLHDQELLAVELDLGAGPFAEQHTISRRNLERHDGALFIAGARSDRDDLTLGRLLLDRVGNDDPASRFLERGDTTDDDALQIGIEE